MSGGSKTFVVWEKGVEPMKLLWVQDEMLF